MILLGAHYLPFIFLYGMPMFAPLSAVLAGGGLAIALYWSTSFSVGAWYTGITLLVFAAAGRVIADREHRARTARPEVSPAVWHR